MERFQVADIIRYVLASRIFLYFGTWTYRVLAQIAECGTGILGGFRAECYHCGYVHQGGRHCNGRHCPNCGGTARALWAEKLAERLLPTHHFHVVFTVPYTLEPLFMTHQRDMLGILMCSASEAIKKMAETTFDGGTPAFVTVLHTWTQELEPHYHVHALIAGGALSKDGTKWIPSRPDFLFPTKALSAVFRGIFLSKTIDLAKQKRFEIPKTAKKWNVHCAPPFRSAAVSTKYFARYANRVALANERILDLDESSETVTLSYRRDPGEREPRSKTTHQVRLKTGRKGFRLTFMEFMHRFVKHILPRGFVKIRYGGLYANHTGTTRKTNLPQLLERAGVRHTCTPEAITASRRTWTCPDCQHPLVVSLRFARKGAAPPW